MGATDNAFIKAYDEHSTAAERRRRRAAQKAARQKVVTAESGVSDLVAQPAPASSILQTRVGHTAEEGVSQLSFLHDSVNEIREHSNKPASARTHGVDATEIAAGPHTDPNEFVSAAAANVRSHSQNVTKLAGSETARQIGEALSAVRETEDLLNQKRRVGLGQASKPQETWQPQWEVDSFRWSLACEQLQEVAPERVAEIIRPVLNSAWQGDNVIAITSFDRGEGASTVAMCVARMAASFNVSVALIEGDLEHPNLGANLGLSFDDGWNSMEENQSLNDVAVGSIKDSLVVLPASSVAIEVNEAPCGYVLEQLSQHFELVILDAGPVFTAAYRWFEKPVARHISGTLVVRDVRETAPDQIEDVRTRLNDAGIEQVAIVENFEQR